MNRPSLYHFDALCAEMLWNSRSLCCAKVKRKRTAGLTKRYRGRALGKWIHVITLLLALVLPRFIKKLEHSWKALVYDGVSWFPAQIWHTAAFEWAFSFWSRTLRSPLPLHRTRSRCTGQGFMPAASSSSWAQESSGRLSVSLQADHGHTWEGKRSCLIYKKTKSKAVGIGNPSLIYL